MEKKEENHDDEPKPRVQSQPGVFLPPGIKKKQNKRQEKHNSILEFFLLLLRELNIPVNYDHVKSPVKKYKTIPLWYEESGQWHRGDISFLYDRKTVVIIEIHTRKLTKEMKEKEAETHGKDPS